MVWSFSARLLSFLFKLTGTTRITEWLDTVAEASFAKTLCVCFMIYSRDKRVTTPREQPIDGVQIGQCCNSCRCRTVQGWCFRSTSRHLQRQWIRYPKDMRERSRLTFGAKSVETQNDPAGFIPHTQPQSSRLSPAWFCPTGQYLQHPSLYRRPRSNVEMGGYSFTRRDARHVHNEPLSCSTKITIHTKYILVNSKNLS